MRLVNCPPRLALPRRVGAAFFLLNGLLPVARSVLAEGILDSLKISRQSRQVGPGVWHHQMQSAAGPWFINVLEVDRRQSNLQFKTVKAGRGLHGLARTSVMAAAVDAERRRVVAAINGDFFDTTGMPINLQVTQGRMLRGPSPHSVVAFTDRGMPLIEILSASYRVRTRDGTWRDMQGFNRSRLTDETILFTSDFGASTSTNKYGSEAILRLLSPLAINDTLRAVVRDRRSAAGNAPLADSLIVVSGHGAALRWLDSRVAVGDTLLLVCSLSPARGRIVEALGGLPRLLRAGKVAVETDREGGKHFSEVRHPRTAIGFSADSSKVFLVTVDGRQEHSLGMTLYELADFMHSLGCAEALNLDGGGSTTMVVRGKIVNHPSDATGERPVGNALLLISRAPTGRLAHLSVQPRRAVLAPEEHIDFAVAATDSFFNPLSIGEDQFSWRLSRKNGPGKIDDRGRWTAVSREMTKEDSGYVMVYRSPALRDSAKVIVTAWRELEIEPDSLVLQSGGSRALAPKLIDSRGGAYRWPPARFDWEVEGGIGSISPTGVFTAGRTGSGWVRVRFEQLERRIPVQINASTSGP